MFSFTVGLLLLFVNLGGSRCKDGAQEADVGSTAVKGY